MTVTTDTISIITETAERLLTEHDTERCTCHQSSDRCGYHRLHVLVGGSHDCDRYEQRYAAWSIAASLHGETTDHALAEQWALDTTTDDGGDDDHDQHITEHALGVEIAHAWSLLYQWSLTAAESDRSES